MKNRLVHTVKYLGGASLFLLFALYVTGCALPEPVYLDVDVADTASYNLSPAGANVTIFAVVPKDDSLLINYETIAKAMAKQYETDQALDEECVEVYSVPDNEFDIYNRFYLNQLGENSNSSILVCLQDFKYGTPSMLIGYEDYADLIYKHFPFTAKISIFDTLQNKVLKTINVDDYIDVAFESYKHYQSSYHKYNINSEKVNEAIGAVLASYLSTRWLSKEIMFVNYPSDDVWKKGVEQAVAFQFEDAVRTWMPYAGDKTDNEKQAFAAYNIALACHMLGNNDLALQWIKFSRSRYKFPQSTQLFNELNK